MEGLKPLLEEIIKPNTRFTFETLKKKIKDLTKEQIQLLVNEGFIMKSFSIRDPNEGIELYKVRNQKELEFYRKSKPKEKNKDTGIEYSLEELVIIEMYSLANPYSVYNGLEPISLAEQEDFIIFACDLVSFSEDLSASQLTQFKNLGIVFSRVAEECNIKVNEMFGIPSGDGYFLIFQSANADVIFNFIDTVSEYIIDKGLALPMRIGVHSGPLYIIQHKNGAKNAIGNSINTAARVMSFGDEKHILVTKDFYSIKIKGSNIENNFHECGVAIDKHNHSYELMNYYHNNIGNKLKPEKVN